MTTHSIDVFPDRDDNSYCEPHPVAVVDVPDNHAWLTISGVRFHLNDLDDIRDLTERIHAEVNAADIAAQAGAA